MVDSVYTDLTELKDQIKAWSTAEDSDEAYDLYIMLTDFADKSDLEYKLELWYPTLSGTSYIDLVYYMAINYKNGLSWDDSYEQAYEQIIEDGGTF